ncbi:unnamed protein product [Ceutorhynchus assimilis]|uniref:Endophilin-A n=1 Tax=Ceutorhynchus assimilis TaxID=467358 RepID=A0A9N9QIS4_9CUCU|nr:unnamed protein product [Ceutorhynchus assimilis]
MAFAGLKKQINKANQYVTEKMGGAEGTKLDLDFMDMEKKTDVTVELVEELQVKTKEFLQPNPTARAKMAAVKGISKLSGQAKSNTYPQPEGVLGDCMLLYGRRLGDDSIDIIKKNDTIKVNKQINIPNLIIRPKRQQNVDKTKRDLQKYIKPAELKICVTGTRSTKNGNLLIKCSNKKDIETLKKEAESKLQDYEVQITKMRKPRFKIVNYTINNEDDLNKDYVESHIREQNHFINTDDELDVTFLKKNKKNDTYTILGECSPTLFHKFMSIKRIFIGWERYPIYEDITIQRCFKCQEFFHKNDECTKRIRCSNIADEEIKTSEEKFAESLHLAQMGMFNLLENDVEQISQLATFAEGLLDYHSQCTDVLKTLTETLQEKREEAASRPKVEFVPKTLSDLNIEGVTGIADGYNGTSSLHFNEFNNHNAGNPYNQNFKNPPSNGAHQFRRPAPKTVLIKQMPPPDPFDSWIFPQASPLPSPMKSPARTPMTRQPCCVALYDFDAENPGELSFKENDIITLLNKIDENWFEGSVGGRTGYFPVNYVKVDVALP